MQSIYFHIAYLLTKQECVIIPDWGALVVFPQNSKKLQESGIFCSPANSLGFNPEIKHNDGLLVNSLAKGENISYKEARSLIHKFANSIQLDLKTGKTIKLPWVGDFHLSTEDKVIFRPAQNLSCNADYFGFTNIYLPQLAELRESMYVEPHLNSQDTDIPTTSFSLKKRILTYTGSVAAALIALFVITSPLNNYPEKSTPQNAGIFQIVSSNVPSNTKVETQPEVSLAEEILVESSEQKPNEIEITETKTIPLQYYYIIVASLPDKESAEKTMSRFRSEGFETASVVSSGDRHRISIEKFEDKTKAENYLTTFREENPKHAKAWLLSQRNTEKN